MKRFLTLFILAVAINSLYAEIRLPKIISDGMVLQQGTKVAIWGVSIPNDAISITFGKQTKKTIADADGKWKVYLDELTASKIPSQMTIKGKNSKVTLSDILIGEVWLGSGQSNMDFRMKLPPAYKKPLRGEDIQGKEFEKAKNNLVRLMHIDKVLTVDTLPSKGWREVNSTSLALFSAPAYFFAKTLADELDVPIGIIVSSWGGTRIETWTPKQAYKESPIYSKKIDGEILDGERVAVRYEKMVKDMIPYTIKGFIWYQGESNLINCEVGDYIEKQRILIDSWRKEWGNNKMPFYYVQLAPYAYSQRRNDAIVHTWETLPRFWEAQTLLMKIPYCGMAVINDLVDDIKDIHPSYKWEVGRRLALWALAKEYGKEITYSGPMYESMEIKNDKAIIKFSNVGEGLVSTDGEPLTYFQIAGENGHFRNATATIISPDKVEVSADVVKSPVNVRFAWDEAAMPNLKNSERLPANSFRTNGEKWTY